jgi:hypothetical protein
MEIKKPMNLIGQADLSVQTKKALALAPESIMGGNSSIQDAADGTEMLMMMMDGEEGSLTSGN